jgi:PST family polysaccharide transporter
MTPALSRLQFDPQRFKQLYLKAIMAIVMIGMPLVVFMLVRADQMIFVALGRDWMGAVLLFRLLAPAAFMDTFNIAAGLIFNTLGQTDRQLRLSIISALAIMLGICIGIRWGAVGVAIGISVVTLIIRIPAYRYVYAKSPVLVSDLLAILWRPATCSLVAGAVLFLVPNDLSNGTLPVALFLLRDLIIFAVSFVLVWLALPRGPAIMADEVKLLKNVLGASKKRTNKSDDGAGA